MEPRLGFVILVVFCFKETLACFSYNQVQDITIKAGSSFYQECPCMESKSSVKYLKWLDIHGRQISALEPGTKSHIFTETRGNSISLQIPNMSKTMSGVYKCVTSHDGKVYTHAINIVAYDPLYFINTSENQYLINGKDSLITCEARGETNPLITWHKGQDDFTEIVTDEKYEKISVGIMVKNVTEKDAGIYKCTASVFETSEEVDRYFKIQVLTLPIIKELKANPDRTVVEGASLSIECMADGVPHPEYRWNKTSMISENATWYQESNAIVFNQIEADDRGNYECVAYNDAGETRQEIKVEVLYPPTIQVFDNVTAVEGSTVQIVCKAKGRPRPEISIFFDYYDPEETGVGWDRINTSETETTFTLTYLNVSRRHAGIYACNASNDVDAELAEINMTVLYKPHFEVPYEMFWGWNGKKINFSCEHESNPNASIVWRYHGNEVKTDIEFEMNNLFLSKLNRNQDLNVELELSNNFAFYGFFECIARNEFGESKKSILVRQGHPPGAIQNVYMLNKTATSVIFGIDGPVIVEGPPVLGFTAEYDEVENYNITNIHNNRTWALDRPNKIEKMKPNTTYFIRFAAVNAVGVGEWTEFIGFTTPEKSIPEPPMWVEKDETITEEVDNTVQWKAPEENGDPIDYYILRNCPVKEEEIIESLCVDKIISTSITKFDLSKLTPNTTYYLELVAHNSEGNSSVAETYITIPASKLHAPVRLPTSLLSAEAVIGISVVVVFLCLVALDVMLLLWKKQGILATCVYRQRNKNKDENKRSRDKKGLLRDTREKGDNMKRADDKEFEYNRPTGIITGKHSSV